MTDFPSAICAKPPIYRGKVRERKKHTRLKISLYEKNRLLLTKCVEKITKLDTNGGGGYSKSNQ